MDPVRHHTTAPRDAAFHGRKLAHRPAAYLSGFLTACGNNSSWGYRHIASLILLWELARREHVRARLDFQVLKHCANGFKEGKDCDINYGRCSYTFVGIMLWQISQPWVGVCRVSGRASAKPCSPNPCVTVFSYAQCTKRVIQRVRQSSPINHNT